MSVFLFLQIVNSRKYAAVWSPGQRHNANGPLNYLYNVLAF